MGLGCPFGPPFGLFDRRSDDDRLALSSCGYMPPGRIYIRSSRLHGWDEGLCICPADGFDSAASC